MRNLKFTLKISGRIISEVEMETNQFSFKGFTFLRFSFEIRNM